MVQHCPTSWRIHHCCNGTWWPSTSHSTDQKYLVLLSSLVGLWGGGNGESIHWHQMWKWYHQSLSMVSPTSAWSLQVPAHIKKRTKITMLRDWNPQTACLWVHQTSKHVSTKLSSFLFTYLCFHHHLKHQNTQYNYCLSQKNFFLPFLKVHIIATLLSSLWFLSYV